MYSRPERSKNLNYSTKDQSRRALHRGVLRASLEVKDEAHGPSF